MSDMPSKRERRQFESDCSAIGIADLEVKKRLVESDFEHKEPIIAAVDTAAVQLLLLVTGNPIPVADGTSIDTRLKVTALSARAGVRILGWNRLVGLHLEGRGEPLIGPGEFGQVVEAGPELAQVFEEMAQLWYEARPGGVEGAGGSEGSSQASFEKFESVVWSGLQKFVYGGNSAELDVFKVMAVSTRLLVLQKQTQTFYEALLAGVPMPAVEMSPMGYFEQFLAFDGDHHVDLGS